MFNDEQKKRFIEEYTDSVATRRFAAAVFNRFASVEEERQRDIVCFDEAELKSAIDGALIGFRRESLGRPYRLLRQYHEWCVKNNIQGVSGAIKTLSPDLKQVEKMKESTVRGPSHLAVLMDRVFEPVSACTGDNMLRAYLWFAFSGIPEEEVLALTPENLDIRRMVITVSGREYPIYPASLPCLEFCRDAKIIKRKHPTGKVMGYIDRVRSGGTRLLRREGYRIDELDAVRSQVTHKRRAGGSGFRSLTYGRVQISGQFYRAWEQEQAGLEPDFDSIVRDRVNPATALEPSTFWSSKSIIRRDYEIWKQTLL